MSGTDDGLQQQHCYAPLPYKVAAVANVPIRSHEEVPSEDRYTITTARREEVYTSSC